MSSDALSGRARSSQPATAAASACSTGTLVEWTVTTLEQDAVAAGERDAHARRVGDRRGHGGFQLGALDPRRIDRVNLPEPPVDGHVAARLQLEVVNRALEDKAPAVDRRRGRGDRSLELLAIHAGAPRERAGVTDVKRRGRITDEIIRP